MIFTKVTNEAEPIDLRCLAASEFLNSIEIVTKNAILEFAEISHIVGIKEVDNDFEVFYKEK